MATDDIAVIKGLVDAAKAANAELARLRGLSGAVAIERDPETPLIVTVSGGQKFSDKKQAQRAFLLGLRRGKAAERRRARDEQDERDDLQQQPPHEDDED